MFHPLWRAIRSLLLGVDLVLLTAVTFGWALLPRMLRGRAYPRLFQYWCRAFVRAVGVELHVHQHYAGRLPAQYILIANHPSAFEDVGIPALFPVRCLAKREVRDWWVVGRIADAAGTVFVRRDDAGSRRRALRELRRLLEAGESVAIYPEGGCKGRRIHHRFESGAFSLAGALSLPIVPVFLHYPAQEDFEWLPGESLAQKIWHIVWARDREVHVHVFDPLAPRTSESPAGAAERTRQCYLEWQRRFLD